MKFKFYWFVIAALFILSCSGKSYAALDTAAPWPMRGHDLNHTGRSPYLGSQINTLKWKFPTDGRVYSSPAIGSDGTVYVGSRDKYLYAIKSDGTFKWKFPTGSDVYSSPAIGSDGTVYVGSDDKNLYAVNSDGTFKWTFPTDGRVYSSPAIGSDGTVYVVSDDAYLYAVNSDGTFKWKFPTGGWVYSSPAIGSDGTVYVGSYYGHLYAINSDGTFKWKFPTGSCVYSSPAIGSDGTVYVGSYDGHLYAINSDGTFKWKFPTGSWVDSSPAIGSDGTVYVGSDDGYLYAINSDGTFKWKYETGYYLRSSPVIGSDGTVYVGSNDYYLYAIKADGSLKWKFETDFYVHSSPAIGSDGTIYVGSYDGHLYAIGIPDGQGAIYGNVQDIGTGVAIANAAISAGTLTTSSNENGNYALTLSPGVYDLTCSKTGYQTITVKNIVVTEGNANVKKLNIELTTPGPLNITTTSLAPAQTGVAYNQRVKYSGGTYPYKYSIASGKLPSGLTLAAATGNISGTPTTSGSYTFSVGVEDAANAYAEREFFIEVTAQLSITTNATFARGTYGQPYFATISAAGGTAPYTFSKTSGQLPSGISVSSNGNLSGTPYNTGSYDFTVTVTDSSGRTVQKSFHLEIVAALNISTSRLNNGITGTAYNQTLAATGGYGVYKWQIFSGILPAGISLNTSSGELSGTPTEPTYGSIVLAVSDTEGRITYKDFTIQTVSPLAILTTNLPTALRNSAFSEAVRINGGAGTYNFSAVGQLPAGLSLNSSTGIISGTPTLAGVTNVSITVTDSTYPTTQSATQNLGIRVSSSLTITTTSVLPKSKKGSAITSVILAAGGGTAPYEWSFVSTSGMVTSNLPPGITLNGTNGEISGTPTLPGDYAFTIKATDSAGNTAQKEFFMHVSGTLAIITGAIPDGGKGEYYAFTLEAAGGLPPYQWRIKSGTLPTGISFNTTGTLSGRPTTRQTYSFTLEVNDSDSPAQKVEKTYFIQILDELLITTTSIPNGRVGKAYSATIQAQLGNPPYSWLLDTGVLPPGLKLTGSPTTATITGTATTPGTYTFSLSVSDKGTPVKSATKSYTIEVYGDVTIKTTGVKTAYRGRPYSDTIQAVGGSLPYYFSIVQGGLPSGLYLNSATGAISGTSNLVSGQSATFKVRVTDSGNPSGSDEKEFTIFVLDELSITTGNVQNAMQYSSYQANLAATGGLSPYSWSISSGALPKGLTLNTTTGQISGKAAKCGDFSFTVQVKDSVSSPSTDTQAYTMTVLCSNDYEISGSISSLKGVTLTLSRDSDKTGLQTVQTDAKGNFTFTHLTNATYVVTPIKTGFRFEPAFQTVIINNEHHAGIYFDFDFNAFSEYLIFTDLSETLRIPEGARTMVIGSSGENTIRIAAGAQVQFQHSAKFQSSVNANPAGADVLILEEASSMFMAHRSGAAVVLTSANGTLINLSSDSIAQSIYFTNGRTDMEIINSGNTVMLNNQEITETDTAVETPDNSESPPTDPVTSLPNQVNTYLVLTESSVPFTIPYGAYVQVIGSTSANTISNTINVASGGQVECRNFVGANVINVLQDSTSDFTVYRSGATVYLQNTSTGTLVKIPATKITQTLKFADGVSYNLVISNEKVMLGSQEIKLTKIQL